MASIVNIGLKRAGHDYTTFVQMKLAALFLGLILASSVFATEGDKLAKSTLQGKVLDAHNLEYLAGAEVRIPSLDLKAYCNLNGEFEFSDLPVGTYSLEIRLVSYKEAVYVNVEVAKKVKLHKFALETI